MKTKIVFYKNSKGEVETRYNRENQKMQNPTAFIVELHAYQVEYIMHNNQTKEVKKFKEKLYDEHKPQEEKFKLVGCSEKISNIIKSYE